MGSNKGRVTVAAAAALIAISTGALAQEGRDVQPDREATYHSGAGLLLSQTYPPGTLHVGMTAGQETSRAYLGFQLPDADLDTAMLTVPVAADAGSSAPETGQVSVCVVPGGIEDGADEAPEADCDSAVIAEFRPSPQPVFVADVADFVTAGRVDIALVPTGGDNWHVGFDSRARQGGSPAALAVSFVEEDAASAPMSRPGDFSPPEQTPPQSALGGGVFSIPDPSPPPVAAGQALAEEADVTDAVTRRAAPAAATGGGGGFQYPIVFALPLVLLVAIGVAGDGLTRPIVLREESP